MRKDPVFPQLVKRAARLREANRRLARRAVNEITNPNIRTETVHQWMVSFCETNGGENQ